MYSLAENCEFGVLKDELISDRIVVGITDNALSERIHIDPEVMLEKAKRMVRQRETIQATLVRKRDTTALSVSQNL